MTHFKNNTPILNAVFEMVNLLCTKGVRGKHTIDRGKKPPEKGGKETERGEVPWG